jgi:hypothetical protein
LFGFYRNPFILLILNGIEAEGSIIDSTKAMKIKIQKFSGLLIFTFIMILAVSCKSSESKGNLISFTASLSGGYETPPDFSNALGNATLIYNKDTRIFNIIVNFAGMTATRAYIYKGALDVAGDIVFTFTPPIKSPISFTSSPLDLTQQFDLYAGNYYVNILSEAYPSGEIRGQIIIGN